MEHWEELWQGGASFVYDDHLFRPGTDTFLLSAYPKLKAGLRVCDLGAGTGLLGLLLLSRQRALSVTGLELNGDAVRLAEKTAAANGLEDRLTTLCQDLRQVKACFSPGSFDLVVCNPPYYPSGSGHLAADASRRAARAEVTCSLEDICAAAAHLLRWGGIFCLVHKPERLTDLLVALRSSGSEPKRLRFVCKTAGAAPSLLLLEARRGGRPGLTIERPLLLETGDGTPTAEVDAIYFRTTEDTP